MWWWSYPWERRFNYCEIMLFSDYIHELETTFRRILSHRGINYIRCDLCPKSYSSKSSLDYHIGKHQQPVEKHTCNLCSSQFASEETLCRHKNGLTIIEVFSCVDCGRNFKLAVEHETRAAFLF